MNPALPARPRNRNRVLLGVGGVVLGLVVIVAVCEVTGWRFLRGPLQNAAAGAAAVPVTMEGRFRAHFIVRPRIEVEHLNVAAGGGVQVPHLLDARGMELAWRWSDLWRYYRSNRDVTRTETDADSAPTAALHIRRLRAQSLDAQFVRGADGRASWQIGKPRDPAAMADPNASPVLPRFGELWLAQGSIRVDDEPLDTQLKINIRGGEGAALPAARADRTAPGGDGGAGRTGVAATASASAAANRAPSSAGLDAGQPGYEATIAGRWKALPLQMTMRTGAALPLLQEDEAAGRSPAIAVRAEGTAGAARFLFDGSGAPMGDHRLQGTLQFSGPSLARVGAPLGLTLPTTGPFDLRGELAHDAGVWRLRTDRATIGRSRLDGDFRFDGNTRPVSLTGRLGGSRLSLADLGPSVGAAVPAAGPAATSGARAGVKAAPSKKPASDRPAGRVLPQQRFDLPSLRAMDADVQVAIQELDFNTAAVAPLQSVRSRVLLRAGVLELQDFKATVAGGHFSGNTLLDSTAQPAKWGADLRFSSVDVAGWLRGLQSGDAVTASSGSGSAAKAAAGANDAAVLMTERQQARRGGDQPVRAYVTGTMGGMIKATGRGRSTAEILSTLDGQAQLILRDGTLSHLATEVAGLDVAQALGVLLQKDRPLPLRCARIELTMDQGVVRPRLAVLDNEDTTVRLVGFVNMRDETLALKATAEPRDFSPLALRSPIHVGGTLGKPEVGLEKGPIVARVLGALALGALVGPAAAVLPLLDPGEKKESDPCTEKPLTSAQAAAQAPVSPTTQNR